jgi:hypothetical protein
MAQAGSADLSYAANWSPNSQRPFQLAQELVTHGPVNRTLSRKSASVRTSSPYLLIGNSDGKNFSFPVSSTSPNTWVDSVT